MQVNFQCLLQADMAPKTLPKPLQNRWKIDEKSMKNRSQNRWKFWMHFKRVFGGSWGQHGSKSLLKAAPKGGSTFLTCWVLEGSWGAVGASWGPRADFIDFWSIFDRFLIDFYRILIDFLDDFFNDFSMIWNGLGTSWGPKAVFIDFWSIFDFCLICFVCWSILFMILPSFFNDCSMILDEFVNLKLITLQQNRKLTALPALFSQYSHVILTVQSKQRTQFLRSPRSHVYWQHALLC